MDSPELLDVLLEQQEELFPYPAFPSPDHPVALSEWASSGLNDSEPEDFLKVIINPNDVYSTLASPASDSSISDVPCLDSPQPSEGTPSTFCEITCGTGTRASEPLYSKVVSVHLDWPPQLLLPDASLVTEPPSVPPSTTARPGMLPLAGTTGPTQAALVVQLQFPDLFLTEEEKRLLSQEGVSLPSNLPLTKAEERLLKKVRRKIRNKQSAQDSRRRKKEYIDGLESRMVACSIQNQELQKKVQELEKDNGSLLSQLQKLQALIKQTSNKAAQTSTCLLILIFSLGLIIFPSYSPLLRGARSSLSTYQSSRVISRNILNQGDLSDQTEAPSPKESLAPEPEWHPGEQPGPNVAVLDGGEAADQDLVPSYSGSSKMGINTSAQAHPELQAVPTELSQGEGSSARRDAAKPVHSDEM